MLCQCRNCIFLDVFNLSVVYTIHIGPPAVKTVVASLVASNEQFPFIKLLFGLLNSPSNFVLSNGGRNEAWLRLGMPYTLVGLAYFPGQGKNL